MSLGGLAPFLVAVGLLTLSPGPDTMLVLRNTLRGGRGDGVRTVLGISSGLLLHASLSALGLSVILLRSATLFTAVKLAGAGYLVWLGLQSLRSAVAGRRAPLRELESAPAGRPWREGLLTNVLNPKVAAFYLAFLPQFIAPADPVLLKSLALAGIHIVMGLVWLSIVVLLVSRASRVVTSPRVRRALDGASGAVLAGLGARLAFARG